MSDSEETNFLEIFGISKQDMHNFFNDIKNEELYEE